MVFRGGMETHASPNPRNMATSIGGQNGEVKEK